MEGSDSTPMAQMAPRDALGRFAPGNPGRRLGSRNRVSARVARTLLRDFEANQIELLVRLRRWHLPQYVQVISRLLPRDGQEGGGADGEGGALTLADLRALLDQVEAEGGSLADLEGAIEGRAE
jgi:hypothetical protein